MDIEIKGINLELQKDQEKTGKKSNEIRTPVKNINLGDPSPNTQGSTKRPSLKQAFLTSGGHKRTLSGVVKDVSELNKTSITKQEYNFSDLLGDINYINEDA